MERRQGLLMTVLTRVSLARADTQLYPLYYGPWDAQKYASFLQVYYVLRKESLRNASSLSSLFTTHDNDFELEEGKNGLVLTRTEKTQADCRGATATSRTVDGRNLCVGERQGRTLVGHPLHTLSGCLLCISLRKTKVRGV